MSLTYSINFTPNLKINKSKNVLNYACADNRIHFRFKDFNNQEIISGFEKKLTYLMTYLFNYSYLPKIDDSVSNNKDLKNNFLNTKEVTYILNEIKRVVLNFNIKGFLAHLNYNRSDMIVPFGKVDINCFPVFETDLIIKGSLNYFLKEFNIDLITYLFDDRYIVILREVKESKFNNKFINKQNKQKVKINNNLVKLW